MALWLVREIKACRNAHMDKDMVDLNVYGRNDTNWV